MKIVVFIFLSKKKKFLFNTWKLRINLAISSKQTTKLITKLIYSKKYLKAEKRLTQKKAFNVYMHQ